MRYSRVQYGPLPVSISTWGVGQPDQLVQPTAPATVPHANDTGENTSCTAPG